LYVAKSFSVENFSRRGARLLLSVRRGIFVSDGRGDFTSVGKGDLTGACDFTDEATGMIGTRFGWIVGDGFLRGRQWKTRF
jgi:hypothetical protein